MPNFKKGIFIGKFYPMHKGHLSTLRILSEKSEEAFLIFYYDQAAEEKLANQLGASYDIKQRVRDAQETIKDMTNVTVKVVTIPSEISFPADSLKIKALVEAQIGGEADVQIFGAEEEAMYVPYKYTSSYLLGPPYDIADEFGNTSPLHATAIRKNYQFYRQYLSAQVRNTLDNLLG